MAGVDGDLALPLAPDVVVPDPPHDHAHWLTRDKPAPGGALRQRYGRAQLPNLYRWMDAFTVCDRYFSDFAGNSFPNHAFAIGADAEWTDRNPGVNYAVSLKTPGVPARLVAAGKDLGQLRQRLRVPALPGPPDARQAEDDLRPGRQGGHAPQRVLGLRAGGQDFHPGSRTKMSASDTWLGQALTTLAKGPGLAAHGGLHHLRRLRRLVRPRGAAAGRDLPQEQGPVPLRLPRPLRRGRALCQSPKHVSHVQSSHVSLVAFVERLFGLPPSPNPDAARRTTSPDEHALADCFDITQKPLPPV